jgi:hypothetical protein
MTAFVTRDATHLGTDRILTSPTATALYENLLAVLEGDPSAAITGKMAGLSLIQSQTANNSATLDFTTGINSTYDEYLFILSNITPQTDAVNLAIRVSEDGGSTWKAGASDYTYTRHDNNSTPADAANGATSTALVINGDIGNAAAESLSGEVRLFKPSVAGKYHAFTFHNQGFSGPGLNYSVVGSGISAVSGLAAINGVRFLHSSGNIASGTISLYGVRKS